MKQSKRLQYLLFGLVAIIWGAIIYQVWQYLKPEGADELYSNQQYIPPTNQLTLDTFSLSLNYRDPFTGNLDRVKEERRQPKQRQARSPRGSAEEKHLSSNQAVEPSPPAIEYIGYSVNNDKISRVRLRVDGISVTYKLNEQKAGLLVTTMSRDSVIVNKGAKQFVFYRKQ